MIETGAGEAETEDGNVVFLPARELITANSGNGGGEGFAFNVRRQPSGIIMMPFIGNYRNDGVVLGDEVEDLLDYANRFDYPSF